MALSLWHAKTSGIPHASSYFSRASAQASRNFTRKLPVQRIPAGDGMGGGPMRVGETQRGREDTQW